MHTLYTGKEAVKCDGSVAGYSNFLHILTSAPKIADKFSVFERIVAIDFRHNLDVDYSFQHRYRVKSIQTYFLKEVVFGFIICIVSVMIYFDYLKFFRGRDVYFVPYR